MGVFGIIGEISDYTPKGVISNIGLKVVENVSPGTLAALSDNVEELKTRVGVGVDVVVANDDAASVRDDYDNAPNSENFYEVAGGKAATRVRTH